jgi:two-component system, sensor histidine kinase
MCKCPEMEGFEAVAQIREKEKQHRPVHPEFVAMTADALTGDRERCRSAGMDNYISKTITAAALLEFVAHYDGRPTPFPIAVP